MWFWIVVGLAIAAVLVGAWLMDRRRSPESRGGTPDPAAEQARREAQSQAQIRKNIQPGSTGAP